ncbi:MAG: YfhL family 4Fe-4S dicluster ferredoxin [Acidobacteria bacterium]|nr:YfhL family 4Fe-4S dicluster ferredoxin [Acidobacteriota bacterium]
MAVKIYEDCINCAACEPVCPNKAIAEGDPIYTINPDLCTECEGFHEEKQCVAVCPVDCIHDDPDHVESKDELLAKKVRIHGA